MLTYLDLIVLPSVPKYIKLVLSVPYSISVSLSALLLLVPSLGRIGSPLISTKKSCLLSPVLLEQLDQHKMPRWKKSTIPSALQNLILSMLVNRPHPNDECLTY
ncbi:hypothetical protein G6F62_013434 [Rhizopus arrhizus]|nr:hypothetical protein G6F62_013434 [Rhizopus arrhizus]